MAQLGKVCEHGSLARMCRICELEQENADLRAQLAEAQKDAERYRWLRQFQYIVSDDLAHLFPTWGPGTAYVTWQEAVDFAIDAAKEKS